jgi:heptosyltransferase-2
LTESEEELANFRRIQWLHSNVLIIGVNTGCSPTIPYKKWTIGYHREIINLLKSKFKASVVLLGGKEDQDRNLKIGENLEVIQSPTDRGLRDGLASVQACDIVISGDSLGMHMAIGLKKKVVAWFGPTCSQEIETYGKGIKILSNASCSPCWKRECDKSIMCYDQVSKSEVISAVEMMIENRRERQKLNSALHDRQL